VNEEALALWGLLRQNKTKIVTLDYTKRKVGMISKVKPVCNDTAKADNFSVPDRFFFIQVPEVVILDSVKFFPSKTGLRYT
jgi:hypothetical protein